MSIDVMKSALEALEMLARYENPETRVQVRKPRDGGPIVTMYPHKVATDAADALRTAIEQAEKQEPMAAVSAHTLSKLLDAPIELRRLEVVNAQLLEAMEWIANRCPEQMLKQSLHTVHQEAVHDAGACARAAIAAARGKA